MVFVLHDMIFKVVLKNILIIIHDVMNIVNIMHRRFDYAYV